MISLSQYINEALVLESFTVVYKTYDDMIKDDNGFLSCVKRLSDDEKEEFKNFIEYITKDITKFLGISDVFKVDKEKKQIIFKLNYSCAGLIDNYIKDKEKDIVKDKDDNNKDVRIGNIVIDRSNSKKYFVSFMTSNSKNANQTKETKVKMFELGEGVTTSKTKTGNQEEALCTLWNTYTDILEEMDITNIFKFGYEDLADKMYNYMKENNVDKSEWSKGWLLSYFKIMGLLEKFLNDREKGLTSLSQNNITNYRLCLYNANDAYNSKIGIEYKKFVEQYKKIYHVGKKDAYDPTDVLLYRKDKVGDIISKLKGYKSSSEEQLMKNKTDFFNTLFKEKLLCGISLKKIPQNLSNATYVLFNCGVDNIGMIDGYKRKEDTNSRGNNYFVKASGDFDLKGVTAVEQQNPKKLGDTKEMQVMMRSFGADIVGMDCTLIKRTTASIGKCPAYIWREILSDDEVNLKDKKHIRKPETNIEQFRKFVNMELVFNGGTPTRNGIRANTPDFVKDGITRIIRGALKEGQKCFPFILIH